jgi:NTE family protein
MLRELLLHVPVELRKTEKWCIEAQKFACEGQYSVIHLIYQDKEWEGLAKDYEFSAETMQSHWQSGLNDIQHTLSHSAWLQLPPAGKEFVVHDLHTGS